MEYKLVKADASLAEASAAMKDGRYADAEYICTERIESGAGEAAALLLRSQCFLAEGKTEEAVADHRRALALLSLGADKLMELAKETSGVGMPKNYCAECFEAAAKGYARKRSSDKDWYSAQAYNCAGICRFNAHSSVEAECGDFLQAHTHMQRYMQKKAEAGEKLPDSETIFFGIAKCNIAECYARMRNAQSAKVYYNEALEIFLPFAENDAMCLQHSMACKRGLAETARMDDNNVEAMAYISSAIEQCEKFKGKKTRENLIQLSSCYNTRGTLRYQNGEYREEVEDCTKSLELREMCRINDAVSDAIIHDNRAEAYEQLGQNEYAINDYLAAIEALERSDADNAPIQVALKQFSVAHNYEKLERYAEAKKHYLLCADGLCRVRSTMEDIGQEDFEQLADVEANSRYCAGRAILKIKAEKNYYEALSEFNKAYDLMHMIELDLETATTMHGMLVAMGELYEMFDAFDKAEQCFNEAEELSERFSLQELAELAKLVRMVGKGKADITFKNCGTITAEELKKLAEQLEDEEGEDGDDSFSSESVIFDDLATREAIDGDADELWDGVELSESVFDESGDDGEYVEDDDEIWEQATDDTIPKG